MKLDWNNWCRFCGSAEFTTKFEATPELARIFKVAIRSFHLKNYLNKFFLDSRKCT